MIEAFVYGGISRNNPLEIFDFLSKELQDP